MKQRTMLYLFTLSAVMVSATVYAGETKPEIQIAAESCNRQSEGYGA